MWCVFCQKRNAHHLCHRGYFHMKEFKTHFKKNKDKTIWVQMFNCFDHRFSFVCLFICHLESNAWVLCHQTINEKWQFENGKQLISRFVLSSVLLTSTLQSDTFFSYRHCIWIVSGFLNSKLRQWKINRTPFANETKCIIVFFSPISSGTETHREKYESFYCCALVGFTPHKKSY